MSTPKISVIVPCYNMEQYLSECLESILSQTIEDIEIICIDDGSTDQTSSILDAFHLTDHRVYVVHQSNQGVAAARNRGILLSSGMYIAFMDPDDFYPNNHVLDLLYSKAVENNALICGGSFSNYNNQTRKVTRCYTGDYSKYTFRKEGYIYYRDYQFDFGYHRFIYHRTFLIDNDILFPPYTRFQDPPFFVKAMIAAEKFYAVPQVVYRYRVGIQDKPTSWPSSKLHDMMQGHIDILKLSSEAQLGQLHALTVRRFEDDTVFEPVMKSLYEKNNRTSELLQKFNQSIDPVLLKQNMPAVAIENNYIIRELREMDMSYLPQKDNCLQLIIKKTHTLYQYYHENGFRYTLRLIGEWLSS